MNLYKRFAAKPYSFLVINGTLALDNPSRFRRNFSERILNLIIIIDDKSRDEMLQYNITRKAENILALLSGKK